VLGGPVGDVRFRYHDGRGWRDRYDSLSADRLPMAIEIAVWFDVPEDSEAGGDEPFASDELDLEQADDAPEDDAREHRLPDRLRVIIVPGGGVDGAGSEPEEMS
jgi:hypothetical protein